MIRKLTMVAFAAVGLTACKPTAADIELMLGARGMNSEQAACIGNGLQALTDEDWRTLAALAADVAGGEEAWRNMTLGDVQAKLLQLNDQRLMGTLLRTGMGCTIMHAGSGQNSLPAAEAVPSPRPVPDADTQSAPFPEDDSWLDEDPV